MSRGISVGQIVNWWIRSGSNPVWNTEGNSILMLGEGPPLAVIEAMEQMQRDHGEPPEDIEWGYEK